MDVVGVPCGLLLVKQGKEREGTSINDGKKSSLSVSSRSLPTTISDGRHSLQSIHMARWTKELGNMPTGGYQII